MKTGKNPLLHFLNLKRIGISLLLFIPSISYAHGGLPTGFMIMVVVGWTTIFAIAHLIIIFLLYLGKYFKYLWVLRVSIALSILTGLFWLLSVGVLLVSAFEVSQKEFSVLIVSTVISAINLPFIFWIYKIPVKQYRQKNSKEKPKQNSVFEALNIKEKS